MVLSCFCRNFFAAREKFWYAGRSEIPVVSNLGSGDAGIVGSACLGVHGVAEQDGDRASAIFQAVGQGLGGHAGTTAAVTGGADDHICAGAGTARW